MATYNFTLVLDGFDELTEQIENALFDAGCDDAALGIRNRIPYLEFDREAESLQEAIQSALAAVTSAGFRAVRVEPDDLVTQSEIARRIDRTREYVRQLLNGLKGPGGFPKPIGAFTASSPIWSWKDVARWLLENKIADNEWIREAVFIKSTNAHLAAR